MTATITEPVVETTDTNPEATHFYCGNCYEETGEVIIYCGEEDDGKHDCPTDLSCGCVPCPICYDLVEHDTPCRRCGL